MNDLGGTRLGKYEIQAEIGRGGMGAVYKGYDPLLDRYVAVKVLAPHLVWEKEFVERFLREARAAARLKHPNIVTIYDVGQEGGRYYFVMEYLEGQPLTEIVRQRGPSRPTRCSPSCARWRRRWTTPTIGGWCTGTSSRTTSSWARRGR